MNKKDIKRCREKLVLLKSEIEKKLFDADGGMLGKNQREQSGSSSGVPLHMADISSDNYDRDFNIDIAQGKSGLLHLLDNALNKIDNNEGYAVCEGCECKIKNERLFAMPYVQYCVECQEKQENKETME